MEPLRRHLDALRHRALAGGGFAASPRYPDVERPDANAWAIVALRLHGAAPDELRPARAALAAFQDSRGAIALHPGSFAIVWPTPLGAFAWHGASEFSAAADAAVGFLLASGGVPLPQSAELEHDMSLRGWSWVLGTHSWVEPTSLGLLALRLRDRAGHERAQEARRLLLDRCLPSGGWNYGNTIAFGAELLPAPDTDRSRARGTRSRTGRVHRLRRGVEAVCNAASPTSRRSGPRCARRSAWAARCSGCRRSAGAPRTRPRESPKRSRARTSSVPSTRRSSACCWLRPLPIEGCSPRSHGAGRLRGEDDS